VPDVGRLDVAMQDAMRVCLTHRVGDLHGAGQDVVEVER
jgi:hypothetical protein